MRPVFRYAGYIFDLDGTIYLGDALIPGAKETVAALRREGRGVAYVSNKPLEPASSYAAKLTRLGVPTPATDVINSTRALATYLREQGLTSGLYVVGERSLLQELMAEGFGLTECLDQIQVVIASFDRTLTYDKLNKAHQALVRGARFLATNADATCPMPGGAIPDCAGVIAFLQATTGRRIEVVAGKPSRYILDAALERLGLSAQECLMVGDRLATDMVMGAQAGMDTALVLTGVTTREGLAQSEIEPTYVIESVADLLS